MGISDVCVIPVTIMCTLQGVNCDTGIPHTFYEGNICSVDQKSVRTKSIYTNSLSKIYQIYSIPLAISMSKVPHGQKVQKVKKGSHKELSATDVLFGY